MRIRNPQSLTARLQRAAEAWLAPVAILSTLTTVTPARAAQPSYVDTWGEVRYRAYGYDHIAHIKNRGEVEVSCDVSTDVNPVPQHVEVAPHAEVEVLTFRGSPARVFALHAECRPASPR